MGHNYTCHNYIGHNYIDHNLHYVGSRARRVSVFVPRYCGPATRQHAPKILAQKKKKGSSMRRDPGRMLMCSPVSSFCPPVDVNNSTSILRNLRIFDPSASP